MSVSVTDLIHPTAVISGEAEIASDAQIGPYVIIEGPVRIGPGCVIESRYGELDLGIDGQMSAIRAALTGAEIA